MIQINGFQENQINQLASDSGKTVSEFIDTLINEYCLDRHEALEADKAYKEFIASGEKSLSLDELIKTNAI